MEIAAYCGLPCAVRHAESVCTAESVIALTENALISPISVSNSSPSKLRNMIFAAGSANKYSPNALPPPTSKVNPSDDNTRLRRPSVTIATRGTLAAAIP